MAAGKGKSTPPSKPATDSRSAKNGRFVTKEYADKHKSTTVTEKRK
jgi:hypothetical protein